ncbi:hypothetical protein H5410_024462 [Solanum commersonii]|uniref:Serpin domain-containing protein n=1 Tax=Solanum commersonii TaxID=4109 RepID=A0A9J5ZM10_SOLCO|nr:hypothetical protein H5410_024462 [Solanum commersonii]
MDLQESITNQTDVSFMLAKHIFSKEVNGDTNLVLSPLSIQIALGLIAAGSNGPTQDQLLCFLKSKSINELSSLILSTPSLLMEAPMEHSFKHVVDNVYKASSEYVDFQNKPAEVANQVNQWAKMKTNDLIKEILPPDAVDDMTRLIFANALYFKGEWNEKFYAFETKDHEFHLLNEGSVRAPFMTSQKEQYITAFDGFKMLRLPYKQGTDTCRFCMHFILPDARDGLPALLDKISSEPGFLNRHFPYEKVKARKFLIPKFKITFGFEATKVLWGLGLKSPFYPGGLSEMVDSHISKKLFVSDVYHKSFIEVNEEGTEAAAITAVIVMLQSQCVSIEKEIDFVADHPFLFLVRDESTGAILFLGSVMNPLDG